MKEMAFERQQVEQEIAFARMEAAHEAVPDSLAESLEINKALRTQLGALVESFDRVNSPKERNKERLFGFVLGVVASLIAALIWWAATGQWPVLKT
ncbi:hypothetical protein EIP75_23690 [Aquabacterium soli]|uniref:Uncharacterized protein n=1 Tax=Aquabacterium soli TaxID=2493092 RepID=A0A426UZA8_9BURK|nr:hypothetical protein [Aquabacterium soli]RRR99884.1 hypothetical protein EIP75_23690 [Aquabacterium soli]